MRFEVGAAFALGILLPLLETVRRGPGYWAIETTTMLEDYLAGAVLVMAGLFARRRTAFAAPFLLAAWAGVSAMMSISLISQVEDTLRAADLEAHNGIVLGFKLMLWIVCMASLVLSFRSARRDTSRGMRA